ncbi:MAG: hypothetical protein II401_07775 [Bacteroidales bacterium]|nr:hypothetical protein [Bacteroidales bacterium]
MDNNNEPKGYFSEKTMLRLILKNAIGSNRLVVRSVETMLACKLTLTYGPYQQMHDLQYIATTGKTESYESTEMFSNMLNLMVPTHHTSPTDFMHSQEDYINDSIDNYAKYKKYLNLFEGMGFVPRVVDKFCKTLYDTDDYYGFKASSNMHYIVYSEALLLYQMEQIDYQTFAQQFKRINLFDGHRKPLTGTMLKQILNTIHPIVDLYKKVLAESGALSDFPL